MLNSIFQQIFDSTRSIIDLSNISRDMITEGMIDLCNQHLTNRSDIPLRISDFIISDVKDEHAFKALLKLVFPRTLVKLAIYADHFSDKQLSELLNRLFLNDDTLSIEELDLSRCHHIGDATIASIEKIFALEYQYLETIVINRALISKQQYQTIQDKCPKILTIESRNDWSVINKENFDQETVLSLYKKISDDPVDTLIIGDVKDELAFCALLDCDFSKVSKIIVKSTHLTDIQVSQLCELLCDVSHQHHAKTPISIDLQSCDNIGVNTLTSIKQILSTKNARQLAEIAFPTAAFTTNNDCALFEIIDLETQADEQDLNDKIYQYCEELIRLNSNLKIYLNCQPVVEYFDDNSDDESVVSNLDSSTQELLSSDSEADDHNILNISNTTHDTSFSTIIDETLETASIMSGLLKFGSFSCKSFRSSLKSPTLDESPDKQTSNTLSRVSSH